MTWWNNLKKRLYAYRLRKKIDNLNVERGSVNYQTARHIGILFETSESEEADLVVNSFVDTLRKAGKRVEVLAYFNDKHKREFYTFDFFNKRDLNLIGIPKGEQVEQFIQTPFDVLLCLHAEASPALEYIAATSQARFRVGAYQPQSLFCYELMVHSKSKSVRGLLHQMEHYLKLIHVNNEKVA